MNADRREANINTLCATPCTGRDYQPGKEKWDHHARPGHPGHQYSLTCALCTGDLDRIDAALMAVTAPRICGASMAAGPDAASAGPCVLEPHDGPVHQAADGTKWWLTSDLGCDHGGPCPNCQPPDPIEVTFTSDTIALATAVRRAAADTTALADALRRAAEPDTEETP